MKKFVSTLTVVAMIWGSSCKTPSESKVQEEGGEVVFVMGFVEMMLGVASVASISNGGTGNRVAIAMGVLIAYNGLDAMDIVSAQASGEGGVNYGIITFVNSSGSVIGSLSRDDLEREFYKNREFYRGKEDKDVYDSAERKFKDSLLEQLTLAAKVEPSDTLEFVQQWLRVVELDRPHSTDQLKFKDITHPKVIRYHGLQYGVSSRDVNIFGSRSRYNENVFAPQLTTLTASSAMLAVHGDSKKDKVLGGGLVVLTIAGTLSRFGSLETVPVQNVIGKTKQGLYSFTNPELYGVITRSKIKYSVVSVDDLINEKGDVISDDALTTYLDSLGILALSADSKRSFLKQFLKVMQLEPGEEIDLESEGITDSKVATLYQNIKWYEEEVSKRLEGRSK